jgi:hypothetical protein
MQPDSPLPALLYERALPWAKLPARRRLKAMQLLQSVRPLLRLFCACDVLSVSTQQARVIEH